MVNTLLSVRTWEIPENFDDYLISPVEVNLVTNPNNVVLSEEGEKPIKILNWNQNQIPY